MMVFLIAWQHGMVVSPLFLWRIITLKEVSTTVTAEEQGIPASELAAAMNKIKELQRLLGKKTMVNKLFKEAVISGLHYHLLEKSSSLLRIKALVVRSHGA